MKVVSVEVIKMEKPIPVYDMINVNPTHNFLVRTNHECIVSHNCGLLDEFDFVPGTNVNAEQSRVMKIYRNIKRRMESRFTREGELASMLFLVSSKKSEADALEHHISLMKSNPKVLVIDEPIWNVKPKGTYKSETFKVAVGNKYMKSKVIAPEDNLEVLSSQGYSFIDVPINFYDDFVRDVDTSLNDYAGLSSSISMKFIGYDRLVKCYSNLVNPFTQEIISIGMYDNYQIKDFYRDDLVPDDIKSLPIFIHLDMSLTGDRTGISAVGILGTRYSSRLSDDNETKEKVKELMYRHIFTIGIECPQGSEISLQKNREFIYYLKSRGYNIVGVSTDGYQSADTRQQLITAGYKADIISLDRTPVPYHVFKVAINEGRLQVIRLPVLETELINLEKNNSTGKIDHNCLPADTLIKTNHGDKRIVDLVEGWDKVYSYDLSTGEVIQSDFKNLRHTKNTTKLYCITTESGDYYECTGNHLALTDRGYIRADELTTEDRIIKIVEMPIITNNPRGKKVQHLINEYKDIIEDLYLNQKYSLADLSIQTGFSKTMLNYVLSKWGILRTQVEARSVAVSKYGTNLVTSSSYEIEATKYFRMSGYSVIPQFIIKGSNHPYDLYIKELNLIVEIDGVVWHSSENSRIKDEYTTKLALSSGYRICRITDQMIDKYGYQIYDDILEGKYDCEYDEDLSDYFTNKLTKISNNYVILKRPKLRKLRYGIPGYHGSKLEDHWKYRHDVSLNDLLNYVGDTRSVTINEVYDHFNISDQVIRRMLREDTMYHLDLDTFKAKYLRYNPRSSWKVKKIICQMIDDHTINKNEYDLILTKNEFLNYEITSVHQLYSILGSRNYTLSWLYHILEVDPNEYISNLK